MHEPDDAVTVSVLIRDARGFTYHYEDFVTSSEAAQRALDALSVRGTPRPT